MLEQVASLHGLTSHFVLDGPAISMSYLTLNADNEPSMAFRTLFAQEMIRNGILMPWIAISQSHGDTELDLTLRAADKSLRVVKQALESDIDQFLLGPSIKPVFRAHN